MNWTEAPAYKLAKHLFKTITTLLALPYRYNIKNSIHLMHDLQEILFDNDLKLISFDIFNMYTNIPTNELTKLIQYMCAHNDINTTLQNDLLQQCNTILSQNYFQFGTHQYIQKQGLAMGVPTSSIFSEIYMQYVEHTKIFEILVKHKLVGYFRYVDDVLIIYKETTNNIHEILDMFNIISPYTDFYSGNRKLQYDQLFSHYHSEKRPQI